METALEVELRLIDTPGESRIGKAIRKILPSMRAGLGGQVDLSFTEHVQPDPPWPAKRHQLVILIYSESGGRFLVEEGEEPVFEELGDGSVLVVSPRAYRSRKFQTWMTLPKPAPTSVVIDRGRGLAEGLKEKLQTTLHTQMAVWGSPGSGKSWGLKSLLDSPRRRPGILPLSWRLYDAIHAFSRPPSVLNKNRLEGNIWDSRVVVALIRSAIEIGKHPKYLILGDLQSNLLREHLSQAFGSSLLPDEPVYYMGLEVLTTSAESYIGIQETKEAGEAGPLSPLTHRVDDWAHSEPRSAEWPDCSLLVDQLPEVESSLDTLALLYLTECNGTREFATSDFNARLNRIADTCVVHPNCSHGEEHSPFLLPEKEPLRNTLMDIAGYLPEPVDIVGGAMDVARGECMTFEEARRQASDLRHLKGSFPHRAPKPAAEEPRPDEIFRHAPYLRAAQPLRNERSGRLDARRIAEFFGISVRELSRILGQRSHQGMAKTPDSESLQEKLRPFEEIIRGRLLFQEKDDIFRQWLNTPNDEFPEFEGRIPTPMDLIRWGHLEEVAGLVDDMLTGHPS